MIRVCGTFEGVFYFIFPYFVGVFDKTIIPLALVI